MVLFVQMSLEFSKRLSWFIRRIVTSSHDTDFVAALVHILSIFNMVGALALGPAEARYIDHIFRAAIGAFRFRKRRLRSRYRGHWACFIKHHDIDACRCGYPLFSSTLRRKATPVEQIVPYLWTWKIKTACTFQFLWAMW